MPVVKHGKLFARATDIAHSISPPCMHFYYARVKSGAYLYLRFTNQTVLESAPVNEKSTVILASKSPRRRQLLALGGWDFSIIAADIDESQRPGETPGEYVLRLAETKSRASASKYLGEAIVIAADTAVVDEGEILGKPSDALEAKAMLKRLRGHTHQVYTGLALHRVRDGNILIDLSVTDVPMRDYSDEEIEAYVKTGDPLDKAGAYAIQHAGFRPVANLKGCFASVMGMPLCHLTRMLEQFGAPVMTNVSLSCQKELDYDCPVTAAILRGELAIQPKGTT
jgi:MAF protein